MANTWRPPLHLMLKDNCTSHGEHKRHLLTRHFLSLLNVTVASDGRSSLIQSSVGPYLPSFINDSSVYPLPYRRPQSRRIVQDFFPVVQICSVADPEPDPDPWGPETFGRIRIRSGTKINISDQVSDPDFGSGFRIRFRIRIRIRIRNKSEKRSLIFRLK